MSMFGFKLNAQLAVGMLAIIWFSAGSAFSDPTITCSASNAKDRVQCAKYMEGNSTGAGPSGNDSGSGVAEQVSTNATCLIGDVDPKQLSGAIDSQKAAFSKAISNAPKPANQNDLNLKQQFVTDCNTAVTKATKFMDSQISAAEQLSVGKACADYNTLSTETNTDKAVHFIKASKNAKNVADDSDAALHDWQTAQTGFISEQGFNGNAKGTKAYNLCQSACSAENTTSNIFEACNNLAAAYDSEISKTIIALQSEKSGANTTYWAIKGGEAAVLVGGAIAITKAIQHHNDAKKRANLTADYNNAILHNPDGSTTDCKTATSYTTSVCQPVLMHYCNETTNGVSNSTMPGCQAFISNYCSLGSANQSFCLAGQAQTYCQQTGNLINKSPACQWMATRPPKCNTDPQKTDASCLSGMSNTQLASLCPSFPNDPLCVAYNQGLVVNQPNATPADAPTVPAVSTTPTTTTASTTTTSTGLNGLVGSATSASTTPSTSSTVPTINAQTRMNGQPVANMWAANSSTLSGLCQSGQLNGCN